VVRTSRHETPLVVSRQSAWLRDDAARWVSTGRLRALRALAERTADLRWSPALVLELLDELPTDDAFDELVEDLRQRPPVNFAQVLLLALAARHSWRPDALSRLLRRLGLRACRPHPTSTPDHAKGIIGRLPTHPRPEHHVHESRARLRSVKALRSASTQAVGAGGLDGTVGLARTRLLRDAPGSHPPTKRGRRDRKGMHHG
jgi:hypothetical protein